jgi:hypothetical protein
MGTNTWRIYFSENGAITSAVRYFQILVQAREIESAFKSELGRLCKWIARSLLGGTLCFATGDLYVVFTRVFRTPYCKYVHTSDSFYNNCAPTQFAAGRGLAESNLHLFEPVQLLL